MTEWISVKDRLPDNVKDVIICDEFGLVYPAYYYTFDECWMYSFTVEKCNHKITHWMPLPQKPESEDAENGCMKEASEGEWILHYNDIFPIESTQECSICHAEQYINGNDDNYCPNCGAKMKQVGKG